MNLSKLMPLCAALLVLPGAASASVKNVLSFTEGTNAKPTKIALTRFIEALPAAVGTKKAKPGSALPPHVLFEFKPGKQTPAEFKADGTIPELSIETDVEVPGQAKMVRTTTFTNVVVTSIKVDGTGGDTRETVEFKFATVQTTQKP